MEGDDAAMENPIAAWLMERRAMEVGLFGGADRLCQIFCWVLTEQLSLHYCVLPLHTLSVTPCKTKKNYGVTVSHLE